MKEQSPCRRQISLDMMERDFRKSVDHIIDANEKHNQELKKMAEGGPDQ